MPDTLDCRYESTASTGYSNAHILPKCGCRVRGLRIQNEEASLSRCLVAEPLSRHQNLYGIRLPTHRYWTVSVPYEEESRRYYIALNSQSNGLEARRTNVVCAGPRPSMLATVASTAAVFY